MKIIKSSYIFITFTLINIFPQVLQAQGTNNSDSIVFAKVFVEKPEYNFDEIIQGEKVEHTFIFKNIGNAPLIINNVLSTCGCTVPQWPKEPIMPEEEGMIKVVFDSTSKIGRQNKVITIRSNSKEGDYRLHISAMVLPASNNENR